MSIDSVTSKDHFNVAEEQKTEQHSWSHIIHFYRQQID